VGTSEDYERRHHRRQSTGVTSHDVALAAGVSQATVARTFSSPDLVASETKIRVLEAAERLAYIPNAMARALKSQRSRIVGVVVPSEGEYYQHLLAELTAQLSAAGQQLLLFTFSGADDIDEVIASVLSYQVDGVMVASSAIGVRQIQRIVSSAVRVVSFNQPAAAGLSPSVVADNAAGMEELAEYLVDTGHRSVIFIGGVAAAPTDQMRYRSAARTLGDHDVMCRYIEAGAYTYGAGLRAAARIIDEPGLPDAVMVASDEMALGVIDGLRAHGIGVPGDLSVTGFDGIPQAEWLAYDLTTISLPITEMVKHTLDLLGAGTPESDEIVVPGTLRKGTTVKTRNYERT
jgi:DNA-binding LacI/PurR family transcriptional regulator